MEEDCYGMNSSLLGIPETTGEFCEINTFGTLMDSQVREDFSA